MEVQKVLYMNGGDGKTSYAKNSFIQKDIIEATRSVMEEALLDLYCTTFPDKLNVADLGCSSGPNTLSVVSDVVDIVEKRCRQLGRPPPEFQLYLNDLPGNDFNAVFRSLEAFYEKREGSSGGGEELRRCFVAGVPGSFYGRLFHSSSIHFFHSSSSLHWLSQVPPKLQQHVSLNKRNIYISKESPPSVIDAYSTQFEKDFSKFLRLRSQEIVAGGRMVLILVGRKSLYSTTEEATIYQLDLLTQVLMDMVKEGSIPEEKVDSFNAPFYAPCAMEVERVVLREGSFSLKSLDVSEIVWDAYQLQDNHIEHDVNNVLEQLTRGQIMANIVRAVLESMLASHFGDHIIEDLFSRYSKVLEGYLSRTEAKLANLAVSLVKKF